MAMESAKTGQSLRDRRNKIAMEKTLSSFKEKAGWLNRSVSAGVNSMKSAIDATIKNSMAQVIKIWIRTIFGKREMVGGRSTFS